MMGQSDGELQREGSVRTERPEDKAGGGGGQGRDSKCEGTKSKHHTFKNQKHYRKQGERK